MLIDGLNVLFIFILRLFVLFPFLHCIGGGCDRCPWQLFAAGEESRVGERTESVSLPAFELLKQCNQVKRTYG